MMAIDCKIYKKLIIIITLLILQTNTYAQQIFRRHFLIAYDISTPFIRDQKNCDAYQNALIALFSNQSVSGYNEAYQDNLIVERKNGVPFFDKTRDEISFFHFNVARSEFSDLQSIASQYSGQDIVSAFVGRFIKNKAFYWSKYASENKSISPSDYLKIAFAIQSEPVEFGNGVSMSNFVYPLALDKLDTQKYAEEYVLIILSDFLTGSMLGNTKDLDRIRDIFRVPYNIPLSYDSPVSLIKRKIDFLASQYYRIDFFQYSFISNSQNSSNNLIGILGYKIKPKIGVLTPEDVALFVDGDLDLYQRGYQSEKFKTGKTKIKFTHNNQLVSTELRMRIASSDNEDIVFDDIIARKDSLGEWRSKYTDDRDLMRLDTINHSYYLPVFKINLDSTLMNNKHFENLNVIYQFQTSYQVAGSQPVNFIYKTERALSGDNIHYSTKATIIIMYYLLPVLAVLLFVMLLAVYGKPKGLKFQIDGYLDSYEKTDYQNNGKLVTPYKAWVREKQPRGEDFIPITGCMSFKSLNYPFKWKSPVRLQLTSKKCPAGFELFLKHRQDDIKEFGTDNPTEIQRNKNGELLFVIGIRQTDITKKIDVPEFVKFSVEAIVNDSFLGIKSVIRKVIDYSFHIGADLQDVWVGFDPGTTGSCVAVGSSSNNIILGVDSSIKGGKVIIPSIITIDKKEEKYSHGQMAENLTSTANERFKGFRSIKKMLGFKDTQRIVFENGKTVDWKGKDLAAMLVKYLYGDLTKSIEQLSKADEYKRGSKGEEQFNPQRAVVAIPNNFTANKIQDMLYCVSKLNQFKEIRYIYEAEAILLYYLSNYSKFNKNKATFNSETILVFDMGGATINATVVTAKKTTNNNCPKYGIDILGKIGYGIGGDTIDYCIIKFLLSFYKNFYELEPFKDIFNNDVLLETNRQNLVALAFNIKKEMTSNLHNNYLITAVNLERYINNALQTAITIDENSKMYSYFKKDEKGNAQLFSHPLFTKYIYNNIRDAVNEAVALSGSIKIDKVIFTGRSTVFPLVKETVMKQFKNVSYISYEIDESKTAVAQGACWYGINANAIQLNNLKNNASFGFMKTMSADRKDIKYYELIAQGSPFDTIDDGIRTLRGNKNMTDAFAFDGSKVNFYQIMGKDADKILSEQQKHKFSKISSIPIDQITSQIAMQVNENDLVDCLVELQSTRVLSEKGMVADQEIGEANEEHYTWIVK